MDKNILILRKEFLDEKDYISFLKNISLENFNSYPVFLYKSYFVSNSVLGLIKNKENFLYNNLLKKIEELKIEEIKID